MQLCFATNNKSKLSEIRALLEGYHEILSLEDIHCREELPENQLTLDENSLEKASYVFDKYKINCFADDTGLEVTVLNGAPGVFSARYAGPACSPEDNMRKLLGELTEKKDRTACFRTVITLILNGKNYQFEGNVWGKITEQKRGSTGFGYDPIFIPEGYNKTFAEFSKEEKNKISHRGKAVRKMADFLKNIKD